MNKHSFLSKFLKKLSLLIDSLNFKNSKKFNFNQKKIFKLQSISAKRVLVTLFMLLILSFSYLSIPILYNKSQIQNEIKNQLLKRYDVNFIFSTDMKYNLFPWPNFKFENIKIVNDENIKIADIKNFKINLRMLNFFSPKNLEIKEVF